MLNDQIPRDRFLPLPDHGGCSSATRRTGVEIEFGGLSVDQTAQIILDLWGGDVHERQEREITLMGGVLGKVKVELDISLAKKWAEDMAAQALGDLVPVEIVTAPLSESQLPACEALLDALHQQGGMGTQAKLGYGFGVHLNTEVPDAGTPAFMAIVRAFAVLEDWLRQSDPLDPARRLLPFVNPWPLALVDVLASRTDWQLEDFAQSYARLAPARGFGLDLLPALQDACPDALSDLPPDQLKGGRPTFHYRLPETRLGDAQWSLAYEWNRWVLVEHVACDAKLMAALSEAWQTHRKKILSRRADFAQTVESLLADAGSVARMQDAG